MPPTGDLFLNIGCMSGTLPSELSYCKVYVHLALWDCSWMIYGGRGSTASQRTDGETTPNDAAGKVPVPWGRECQREIARRGLFMRGEASSRASTTNHCRSQHHRHTMSVHPNANPMGLTLSTPPLHHNEPSWRSSALPVQRNRQSSLQRACAVRH